MSFWTVPPPSIAHPASAQQSTFVEQPAVPQFTEHVESLRVGQVMPSLQASVAQSMVHVFAVPHEI